MSKNRIIGLSIFCLVFVVLSCGSESRESKELISHYGYGLDSLREKYFLPAMNPAFVVKGFGMDFVFFQLPDPGDFHGYISKSVFWDKQGVYLERNFFYNSPTERLQIYCLFRRVSGIDTIGVCHWYDNYNKGPGHLVTKDAADSLLRAWKMK